MKSISPSERMADPATSFGSRTWLFLYQVIEGLGEPMARHLRPKEEPSRMVLERGCSIISGIFWARARWEKEKKI